MTFRASDDQQGSSALPARIRERRTGREENPCRARFRRRSRQEGYYRSQAPTSGTACPVHFGLRSSEAAPLCCPPIGKVSNKGSGHRYLTVGSVPAFPAVIRRLDARCVLIGEDRQRLDAREHWKRRKLTRRQTCPNRPEWHRQSGLDTFCDAKAGRNLVISGQADNAASSLPEHLFIGAVSITIQKGAVQANRLACDGVCDLRHHRPSARIETQRLADISQTTRSKIGLGQCSRDGDGARPDVSGGFLPGKALGIDVNHGSDGYGPLIVGQAKDGLHMVPTFAEVVARETVDEETIT